ncbi:MAG: hypothetical protein ACREDM_12980 [Methylocella sp.]
MALDVVSDDGEMDCSFALASPSLAGAINKFARSELRKENSAGGIREREFLLDACGDPTSATFSHPDGSSRLHGWAETPITTSGSKDN